MLKGIWSDLAIAARSLAKAPAFTLVCILSLGIGMVPVIAVPYIARIPRTPPPGVNTAGLVELVTTATPTRPAANSWSYADYLDLRSANTGVDIFGWATAPSDVTLPGGQKTALWPMYVSTTYFRTLGVPLARGPGFDGQPGAVVILAHEFWQKRLSADPDILGKTIKFDEVPCTVAGIAPEHFQGHMGLQGREMFAPLEQHPALRTDSNGRLDRAKEWVHLHGRLSAGVSVAQASTTVAGITARLAEQYPASNKLKAGIVEEFDPLGVLDRTRFVVLEAAGLALTGAVLLVVCMNLSGMMQVRSAMRERELSIRQAIGASRLRLARHLLAEAALLAAAGGAIASVVIFNAPRVISRVSGQPIPPALQDTLKPDLSMIAICIGFCLITTLIFGFLPATRFSRPVIISALKDDAGAGGLRVGRVHRFAAALQVAIAVPLLVLGGISLTRIRATATADLGFESALVYAAPIDLNGGPKADNPAAIDSRIRGLRDTLSNFDGIASATVADGLPLDFRSRPATVSLPAESGTLTAPVRVQTTRAGDGYRATMGIPLLSGRDFTAEDGPGSGKVAIITKPLADRLFPEAGPGEAIGKQLAFGIASENRAANPEALQQTLTIIGVTGDFPTSQITAERPQLLLPLAQHTRAHAVTTDEEGNRLPNLFLIARSAPGEQSEKIAIALENVVKEIDPDFQRERIITGASLRQRSIDDLLTAATVAGALS